MGSVLRKQIINIFDIPKDIIVQLIGKGMLLDRHSEPMQLHVNAGDGLALFEDGTVGVDGMIHEPHCSIHSHISDIRLAFEGAVLTLTKVISDYKVLRNRAGFIIGIEFIGNREEYEQVTIIDNSYTAALSKPVHQHTASAPNFYKK